MAVKPNLPSGKGAKDMGQMRGNSEPDKFAKPLSAMPVGISGMASTHNDIGEMSGFEADTSAYIVKKGTTFGEAAKFNFLPPGMDITNQENADFRPMPFKTVTGTSFPGDGWEPTPRDIPE